MNIQEILDAVKSATLLEIKELVDAMKEEFGVTGAVAVAGKSIEFGNFAVFFDFFNYCMFAPAAANY